MSKPSKRTIRISISATGRELTPYRMQLVLEPMGDENGIKRFKQICAAVNKELNGGLPLDLFAKNEDKPALGTRLERGGA